MEETVVLYTRVSTTEQKESGFSLEMQLKTSKAYFAMKRISLLKHFEEDHSAKTFNRPQWQKLMEYLKVNRKSIKYLAFTRWDRFSRNAEEALGVIKKIRSLGIELLCIDQPLDLSNSESKIMLAFYLFIPEVEND